LSNSNIDFFVEVLGKEIPLVDFTNDLLPLDLTHWETGGITDPLGQLFNWLWTSIQSSFSIITIALEGALWTVRDYLYSGFTNLVGGISSVITGLASTLTSVYSSITALAPYLGSILAPISNMINYISMGISSVGSVLGNVYSSLQGMASNILSGISSTFSNIQSWFASTASLLQTSIGNFASTFSTYISDMGSRISVLSSTLATSVSGIVSSISSTIQGIGSSISTSFQGLTGFLTSISQTLAANLSGIVNTLSSIGSSFGTALTQALTGVRDWLSSSLQIVALNLTQIWSGMQNWVTSLPEWFQDTWNNMNEGLVKFGTTVTGWWQGVQKFFVDSYNSLTTGVKEVMMTLGGFVNPLLNISNLFPNFVQGAIKFFGDLPKIFDGLWKWLTQDVPKWFTEDVPKWFDNIGKGTQEWLDSLKVDPINAVFDGLAKFAKDPLGSIGGFFGGLFKWGQDTLFPIIKTGFIQVGTFLTDIGKTLWTSLVGFAKTSFTWISEGIKDLVGFFTPHSSGIFDDILKWFADLLGNIFFKPFAMIPTKVFERSTSGDLPKDTPMEASIAYMGGLMLETVMVPYALSSVMKSIGETGKITFEGGLPKITAGAQIKPLLLIKHLAKVVWKMPDIFMNSLAYGFGIWMTQPVLRVINSFKRNDMPIEMPNLQEIREIANRASVLTEFPAVQQSLAQFMAYYGYSDWSVSWNLGFYSNLYEIIPTEPFTMVRDRFDNPVEIPLALRHALPSGSEFATMMVRDVFQTFEDFQTTMQVEGYGPDVSKLYYLLHYKYPTMDSLWKFIARVSAGFGWVEGAFEKPAGLGFDGMTPKAMSAKYSTDPIGSLVSLSENLIPYSKWHDYAPFAWKQDFTSDRLIMLDLMARLPDRIEARWMYKWSIIDDSQLQKLVVAEGFHPNQIESVSVAEAMNALTEERGSAKTGILNTFEMGFYSLAQVSAKLQQITTINILGKERIIRLLAGESKLELIRSNYDRAKGVLSKVWSNLTAGFTQNIYAPTEVMQILGDTTTKVTKVLGLDLTVDSAFFGTWLDTFQIRWKQQTVQRIRSLMRVFIYRASQLAEAGENVDELIDQFSATALLTPTESEIMKTLAGAFIKASQLASSRTTVKTWIASRLRRGEITFEVAIAELVKAGLTDLAARAYLDAQSRTRTVSTDKLITMMEDVPISTEMLTNKMNAEGVPADEQKLYLPFAVAQEIKEEMATVATEFVGDLVGGVIDEATLRTNLDNLATLNNTVKTKLGVDWIVLSPTEREYMIYLAKLRRTRSQMPKVLAKTLSSDKLISIGDNVPVDTQKLVDKMTLEGIPADEQKLMIPFSLATEISAEMGRVVTELLTDVAGGVLSIADFEIGLNDLATLGGAVPIALGVPWIVLSPLERQLLINLAKLRRARTLAKQAGVK